MENKKIKLLTQIIFYGALWGFIEATLGYALHWIPTLIAGTIMFPIAAAILMRAYNKTNSKKALLYIGMVAASIKSIDLFLPSYSIFKTINPMVSIVLESLLVFAVVMLFTSEKVTNKIAAAQIASIGWRVGYVMFMTAQFIFTGFVAASISSIASFLQFVILSGAISGLMATALIYLDSSLTYKFKFKFDVKPVFAVGLLLIAAVATFIL
ncbi:MAG: hypothetical protein KAJ22_04915 [Candidatus Izimaplasma sp.]|nr:hypothetical protein [Candidatus Izimaplasma bacterium]